MPAGVGGAGLGSAVDEASSFIVQEIEKIVVLVKAEVASAASVQSILNERLREIESGAARGCR